MYLTVAGIHVDTDGPMHNTGNAIMPLQDFGRKKRCDFVLAFVHAQP